MPLMHCEDCHHEWETIETKSLCAWCGAKGYILEEKTSLDRFMEKIKDEKYRQKLARGARMLLGNYQPSIVTKPADRIGQKKNEHTD